MLLQTHGCLPAQIGHPLPSLALLPIVASHSWACPQSPSVHFHHTIRLEPQVTECGERGPLRVGCHCAARSGRPSARLGCPAAAVCFQTRVRDQAGVQPGFPFYILLIY